MRKNVYMYEGMNNFQSKELTIQVELSKRSKCNVKTLKYFGGAE